MRTKLSAGLAISALTVGSAHAQMQSGPGFFGYLDGSYLLPTGSGPRLTPTPGINSQVPHGDGFGIDGTLGWSFGALDVAIGGSYHDYSAGRVASPAIASTYQQTDSKLWFIEGEVGWTSRGPGWGVRPALAFASNESPNASLTR